ncbi:MAG: aromatic-L-amino-acid decarboxylase [Saprospiraceae bacterium]|jgi:aromatic-L-amino-acid decarboxylase
MNPKEFRKHAHQFVDWMADYMETIEEFPVKSQVQPGDIFNQIPATPPIQGEDMNTIFEDFKKIILPGMTHWQSPNYYAYFNANTSPPSILAEMLTATLGAQCMKWETSPAAAELEERVMNWLRDKMGIPKEWEGVIHDTASTATLAAILCAREQQADYQINENGFNGFTNYRVYCSQETHSSIEKGVKIAGIGKQNLVKIAVDENQAMRPDLLAKAIEEDMAAGLQPLCVVAAIGTTGTTAIDPLGPVAGICEKYKIWLHVDAAFAGSALLLPEFQWMIKGIEKADSFVFNPHKWLFTNFDCTAYFVKDRNALLNTFAILPEYLKTKTDGQVNNYCDWGIPLGRRFRALKLWFVIRYYGIEGLQQKIRYHIDLAKWLEKEIEESPDFKMLTKRNLNLVCFHYTPKEIEDITLLNQMNEALLHRLNATGKLYLTHTKINGIYTLRMVIGQTNVERRHVEMAWGLIRETALVVNG